MYLCRFFDIHELVPPDVYHQRGEKAWNQLDERLLITADRLRKRWGSITVNNYYWGGPREWSGLRTPDSPYYSRDSGHTVGCALDMILNSYDVEQARNEIIKRHDIISDFEYITEVELGTSWLHISTRNSPKLTSYYP